MNLDKVVHVDNRGMSGLDCQTVGTHNYRGTSCSRFVVIRIRKSLPSGFSSCKS